MEFHEVTSSNIEKVGYDKEDKLLEITFKSGGVYWYLNFSEVDFAEFISAESKGKHFHRFIRDNRLFPYTKVTHFVQDVDFDAVVLANARLIGKDGYLPFSYLSEKYGWDFMEAWDKNLGRTLWYNRQNDEYKLAVEEAITKLGE